jgi:hypothetical protein
MVSRHPNFFLQHRGGIESPTTWRGRRIWVVSRASCGFRVFRLPNAEGGRAKLRDFAMLKAREWAPYDEVGFHLHLTEDGVRIWAWDGARVGEAINASGINRRWVTVLPETALQEPPGGGLHLIGCVEGCEGQFWADGELRASRWWADAPSREQWIEFQRAAGVPPVAEVPSRETPRWRRRPWTNSGEGVGFGVERRSRELALATAALLLAGYGYFGGVLARDAAALADLDGRLQQAEQRSAPAVADRARAVANLEFLENYRKLNPFPPQLALFARVAEKLPPNGARLTAWSYQQGELQFTIFSPTAIDILFYVKTYSAVEGFADVTATAGDNEQSLRIKLRLAKL